MGCDRSNLSTTCHEATTEFSSLFLWFHQKRIDLIGRNLFLFSAAKLFLVIILFVIADLLLKYEKATIAVLPQMAQCLEIVQDPKGLSAIIWILGEYGQVLSHMTAARKIINMKLSTEN